MKSHTSADHANDSAPRKRRIRGAVAVGIVLIFLGIFTVINLDGVGHRWVQCEVMGANAEQGDQYSASAWVVVLETQDCGQMLYVEGVDRDNAAEKAAEFEPGQYEMKMGLTSQWAADGLLPGLSPSFEEYRQVQ